MFGQGPPSGAASSLHSWTMFQHTVTSQRGRSRELWRQTQAALRPAAPASASGIPSAVVTSLAAVAEEGAVMWSVEGQGLFVGRKRGPDGGGVPATTPETQHSPSTTGSSGVSVGGSGETAVPTCFGPVPPLSWLRVLNPTTPLIAAPSDVAIIRWSELPHSCPSPPLPATDVH